MKGKRKRRRVNLIYLPNAFFSEGQAYIFLLTFRNLISREAYKAVRRIKFTNSFNPLYDIAPDFFNLVYN